MEKLKEIWQLSDPFPTPWYEISCYLKTALGLVGLILGLFLFLSPWFQKQPIIFGFAIILGPAGRTILAWEEKIFGQNLLIFGPTLGILLVASGLWLFWQIKLVKKLLAILRK